MSMKVLMLLTNPFKPDPRVYDEARALVKAGYEVTVLAWDREGSYPQSEVVDGINVVRLSIRSSYGAPKSYFKGLFKYYLQALKFSSKRKFHIVHAHDFDTLPLGVMMKKLHNLQLIYDAHDLYASMIEDVVPRFIAKIVGNLERKLIKYADGRIAATEALAKEIFSPLSYEVVMNAKKLEDFEISEEKVHALREKINPDNGFLIVYIGILKLWEPIPYVIDAVKSLRGVRLVVGGDGPHREEILERMKGAKNILYVGWVKRELIPLYTKAADLIIITSDYRKRYTKVAVANKIMEAFAAGKPVIAGAMTEGGKVVEECKAGLLCKFGDVECLKKNIKMLMNDRVLYETLAQNAKRCAKLKYNWDVMEKKLLKVYNTIRIF